MEYILHYLLVVMTGVAHLAPIILPFAIIGLVIDYVMLKKREKMNEVATVLWHRGFTLEEIAFILKK